MFKVTGTKMGYAFNQEVEGPKQAGNLARKLQGAKVTLTEEGFACLSNNPQDLHLVTEAIRSLFKEFADPDHTRFSALFPDSKGWFWQVDEIFFNEEKGFHDVLLSGSREELRQDLKLDFLEFCSMFDNEDVLFVPLEA